MYENNPSNAEYPEVTPDPSTIEQPADQKRAVATATAGTVVLGAAAYGLSLLDDSSNEPVADNSSAQAAADAADARARASTLPVVTPVVDPNASLNTSLDHLDDLTFDEAFAAARHQMGPGHHFTWHNGLYNTYYEPELDHLSRADRLAFLATLPNAAGMKAPDMAPDNAPRLASHHGSHHPHHVAEPAPHEAVAQHEQPAPNPTQEPTLTVIPMAATAPVLVPLAHNAEPGSETEAAPQPVQQDDFAKHHDGIMAGAPIDSVEMHDQLDHDAIHLADNDPSADAHHHFGH